MSEVKKYRFFLFASNVITRERDPLKYNPNIKTFKLLERVIRMLRYIEIPTIL